MADYRNEPNEEIIRAVTATKRSTYNCAMDTRGLLNNDDSSLAIARQHPRLINYWKFSPEDSTMESVGL